MIDFQVKYYSYKDKSVTIRKVCHTLMTSCIKDDDQEKT